MYKLCVFGGTTEGRELVEFLNTQPCRVTACVATEYGQTLLPEGENLTVSARPMPVGEIGALLQAERFDLVIDATHPYAASITKSIAAACEAAGVEHWRLLRGASEAPEDAVFAENTDEAVRFLSGTEGNILLTTGSKELSKFAALPDFAARCWARVLPLLASLEACGAAGLSPSHIFALQGPFSREMDEAMLHRTGARWLVTKDGGAAGGFQEKAAAARRAGARLLVIGRPAQETGSSLPETIGALCARFGFSCRPRVTIVGRQRGRADRRGPRGDPCGGRADRRAADAGGRRPARPAGAGRHCAGGNRRSHPRASAVPPLHRRHVGRHRLFQRHEEAPAAAAGLRNDRPSGPKLAQLSLRPPRRQL